MDPFLELCKSRVGGGGLGDREDIGEVYRNSVLHQRGYGFFEEYDFSDTYGVGFGDVIMQMLRVAAPVLKQGLTSGLKMLGNTAVSTAANIAQDAIAGENVKDAAKKHVTAAAEEVFAKAPGIVSELMKKRNAEKRKANSRLSAGKLVASARRRRRLDQYPALEKLT
jgi:hypothetical protein